MAERKRFTVIHMAPIGYRSGQYIAAMKRVETADLRGYLERHDIDATHVFEGWPKLAKQKEAANG